MDDTLLYGHGIQDVFDIVITSLRPVPMEQLPYGLTNLGSAVGA